MIKYLYILRLIGDDNMAYIPGSIGRTLLGELFVVDADGTAHNEGSDGFQSLWTSFILAKRPTLLRLYDMVYANYWDMSFNQLLFGRPRLMTDSELCIHMYRTILIDKYPDMRSDKVKIKCVRDYITTWAPHVMKIQPMQTWIPSLISFVSSDVIFKQ